MEAVFALADRITVLRDGVTRGTLDAAAASPGEIIRLMVGRRIEDLYPRRQSTPGRMLLRVRALSVAPSAHAAPLLRDIDLDVAAGEVLGIGGLMGAGRSELLLHLIGLWGQRRAGSVELDGQPLACRSPREALRAGLALVTEDRKRYGLVLQQGAAFNLTLSSLGLALSSTMARGAAARSAVAELHIKTQRWTVRLRRCQAATSRKSASADGDASAAASRPRGIDVGAKLEVYELINRLTHEGKAIVLASSELGELLGMSDRIVMLHEGRIGGVFQRQGATQERLLAAGMGRSPAEAA
jgi:D-xylose transport system ATP-binding protein